MKKCVVATVLVVYLSVYCKSTADQPPQDGVCQQTVSRVIYEVHQTTRNQLCWSWTFRCKRVIYRRDSYTVYMLKPMCCTGYTNSSGGGCKPYCENCQSPKICTAPNVCTCPPGWRGDSCSEDIDECLTDNGGCEQICTNTNGSYTCSCSQNYLLDENMHNCTEHLYVEITFVFIDYTTDEEMFSLKLNVPSQNASAILKGAKLMCNDSNNNVILHQNITNFTTALKLDMNKAVTCCLSALTIQSESKCIVFNEQGSSRDNAQNSNTLINDTKLAVFGGVGGAIVLLTLLLIIIITVVIVYKACIKSKRNNRLHILNETSSYEVENEIYETNDSEVNNTGGHLSSGYSQIYSRERPRRVQYSTIRFDNRSQATTAGKGHLELKTATTSTDEAGYLRILN